MAIMSTYSSELISISSIATYDVYKMYFRPSAPGKQLMRVNYVSMSAFAFLMGAFSTMLYCKLSTDPLSQIWTNSSKTSE